MAASCRKLSGKPPIVSTSRPKYPDHRTLPVSQFRLPTRWAWHTAQGGGPLFSSFSSRQFTSRVCRVCIPLSSTPLVFSFFQLTNAGPMFWIRNIRPAVNSPSHLQDFLMCSLSQGISRPPHRRNPSNPARFPESSCARRASSVLVRPSAPASSGPHFQQILALHGVGQRLEVDAFCTIFIIRNKNVASRYASVKS